MIYLIDDSDLKKIKAEYVFNDAYKGILSILNNPNDFSNELNSIVDKANCILIHRTFNSTETNKEKIIDITNDGEIIPFVVFSAGDADNAVFDENYPKCIRGLKKNVFYERFKFFLDNYLDKGEIDLRILAYGNNYESVLIKNWYLNIMRELFSINGYIKESVLGTITKNGDLKNIIDASNPALGISYDDLIEKLLDKPIEVGEFKLKLNEIVNSFCQYGENIYTWK